MLKYISNEKGELDAILLEPLKNLLLILMMITFLTLILQNKQHSNYHAILDEMARAHLLKPMEEEGGLTNDIWQDFQKQLIERNISPEKVTLEDATWYPVDRGEPVEVYINSSYKVRALAYIGGPVLDRPTPVRKIGASQKFFR